MSLSSLVALGLSRALDQRIAKSSSPEEVAGRVAFWAARVGKPLTLQAKEAVRVTAEEERSLWAAVRGALQLTRSYAQAVAADQGVEASISRHLSLSVLDAALDAFLADPDVKAARREPAALDEIISDFADDFGELLVMP